MAEFDSPSTTPRADPPGRPGWRSAVRRAWGVAVTIFRFSRRAVAGTAELERQLIFSLNPKRWPSLRQLQHGYRILSPREQRVVRVCLGLIVAAVVWIGFNQILRHVVDQPVAGGSYAEAVIGQPRFLNPVFASRSAVDTDLTRLIFSGLFRYNDEAGLEPDLATGYTASDDGRTYTVTLRENLVWHDGEPLTADDALFTFSSLVDRDVQSPLAPVFRGVVVEKVDDRTLRFTLKNPYGGFLNTLTVGLIPQHVWGAIAPGEWAAREENLRPIGAGPWQYTTLTRDVDGQVRSYVLSPARSSNAPPERQPFLQQLVFRFFPDTESALEALGGQGVDGLAFLSASDRGRLRGTRQLEYYDLSLPAVTAIFFNLSQSSAIGDVAVRRALRSAVDRSALVRALEPGEATVASGPLPGNTWRAAAAEALTLTYNPAEAEDLLTRAGWERIGAIRQNKQGQTLSVALTVVDRTPDRKIGQAVQVAWRQIGVETKIDLVSPATPEHLTRTALRPRAYETLLYTVVYGATVDPYPFWHSSQRVDPGLNLSLFSSKEADDAIERGRRTLDETDRQRAYADLYRTIARETPAIFLLNPTATYAVSRAVRGVTVNRLAVPADRFNAVHRWYVKTKKQLAW